MNISRFLHPPPDFRGRAVRHHLSRRPDRDAAAADQRVSGSRAADGRRARAVSRRESERTIAETVAAPLEEQINGVENMLYMLSQAHSRRQ